MHYIVLGRDLDAAGLVSISVTAVRVLILKLMEETGNVLWHELMVRRCTEREGERGYRRRCRPGPLRATSITHGPATADLQLD